MASYAVASIEKRYLEAMTETDPERRKDVEIRLPSHCRLPRIIRSSGKRCTRLIFYETGKAVPIGAKGLMVDVSGVEVLTPAEVLIKFPREVEQCGLKRWKVYGKAKRLCCIALGERRVRVDDIVLLRPLNVWLQRQVNLPQDTLMFCKMEDLGKTIKLPFCGGQRVIKLQIAGHAQEKLPS
jgi:hypothetical protein